MYTSYIGKKFLKYYNKEYKKKYSAEEFFDDVMFPLFFTDERHLMHVGNSPFFQKVSAKDKAIYDTKTEAQHSKLKEKITNGDVDGAVYVGYGSGDSSATTSGQLSELKFEIESEELYSSWIGQAFSIGVKGGTCLLVDDKEILLSLFRGWTEYSKFYKQTPNIKDKQIETWNGNYIYLIFNSPSSSLRTSEIEVATTQGKIAIQTIEWTKLIFILSKTINNQIVTVYCYTLSQTNQTLGFLNIYLESFNELYELRDKYFIDGSKSDLTDSQIDDLIPFYTLTAACKQGTLGLKSIEPKGLRKYLPKQSYKYSQGKIPIHEKEKNYYLYKLWILAMLNKKELHSLAKEIAQILVNIDKSPSEDTRGKTSKKNFLADLFECNSTKDFIDKMTELNKQIPEAKDTLSNAVGQVVTMPRDNFPLFITLIKFEYYNKVQ